MAKNFSKKEAIRFGWETMKQNFWFWAGILVIVGAVSYLPGVISDPLKEDTAVLAFAISLAGAFASIFVGMGLIKITLAFVDGIKSEWRDLFSQAHLFVKYVAGSILYGIIVFAGMILLIVPGIIWSIQFGLYRYLIIDKGMGPIDALKRSSQITRGAKWNLFLLAILLGLINFAGLFALGIGLFATLPTAFLAHVYVYRKLLAQTETELEEVAS